MGTIPAPNIAQEAGEIAQAPMNALAEYQRVAQLKAQTAGMQQEQQQRAQQMEVQRRQMQDQDALTKTLAAYDPQKHTINDIPKLITQNGGSGQAALSAQQGLIAQKESLAKLSDEQFAQEQKKADLIAGVHDEVSGAPPEQKQEVYQRGLHQLGQAGVDVSNEPEQYPGDEAFAQHLAPIRLHSAIVAEAQKDRELTTKEQEADAKDWKDFPALGVALNTRTGATRNVSGGQGAIMSPEMMASKYVDLQKLQNAGQKLGKDDQAWKGAYEKYKTLVPVANFNLQNAGAAADGGGNPSQIAQALANNQMKWSEAVSPRTPQSVKNAIMAQVFKLNPNYDTAEFGLESDAAKKARSGAWADTRVAYNTAIDHADQLEKAARALKNNDVKALNSMKNFFKTEFGSPDVPNFQAIANAYNHEVTSVISKGHITDAEVATGHAVLPDNAGLDQILGVTGAFKNLMASKRKELDKVIKAGAGKKADATLEVKSGGEKGGDLSIKAPNGKTYHFPDQASLDRFKQAAGIQ